jgi:hypothetical protein
MLIRPFPVQDDDSPSVARTAGLRLPVIRPTADTVFNLSVQQRLGRSDLPEHALGRLESLVLAAGPHPEGRVGPGEIAGF